MNNFYKCRQWQAKRQQILRRDEYMCQECKRYGRTTAASTVHHIVPLAWCLLYHTAMAMMSINLVSLCSACHDAMHDRDSDQLTARGINWVRRIGEVGQVWLDANSQRG